MAAEPQYNPTNDALADIGVKLRDIEEKQNIIKDRILLIGENLISEKEETNNEVQELKTKIASLNEETRKLRLAIERLIDDTNNMVRRNEFQVLQRQFEMFQPLELARISDVEDMIQKALKIKKS